MNDIADIIEEIMQVWCVADSERRALENGFEWLPGSHAVRVRVARHDARPERIRIWITTDYLRSIPIEDANFVRFVGLMSGIDCSGYSLVYPPLDVWKKYFDNRPAELEFFSSAYVDQHTAGWLPGFLAQIAIMQPINAEIRSKKAHSMYGGGEPAYAGGGKKDPISLSPMLSVTEHILAPEGQKDSEWIGCEEFQKFADQYAKSDACYGFGDDKGMTLEAPFGDDSALIRFRTDQKHPQLGSGLLIFTQIRSFQSFDEACAEAAGLNFLEARLWTDFPQFGCWHPWTTTKNEADWAHSCFIPNALFRPGLVEYLALWSLERVRWVRRTRFPDLKDKTMWEIITSRWGELEPPPDPDRRKVPVEGAGTGWVPQYLEDQNDWEKLLLNDDRDHRLSGYRYGADMLLGEIMRFAALHDAATAAGVRELYDRFLKRGMSLDTRQEIYRHAAGFRDRKDLSPAVCILFICEDPDSGICSTAVIDWVSAAGLTDGDPMSRVKDVIDMIVRRRAQNVGALFGGLLNLGDPRVCALLVPLRDRLTDFEANEAMRSFTGFIYAATTEFLLDWLEGLKGDKKDHRFGIVASGLSLLRTGMQRPEVMTGERPFPWDSVTPEEQRRMARYIPIEEYTERIAPRLRTLERREPEPKLMPQVLEAWGVSPSGDEPIERFRPALLRALGLFGRRH
jgi:hypothetical protein